MFTIDKRLGSGAYSKVYKVSSPSGSNYALKLNIKFKGYDFNVAYREIQYNIDLRHKYIVDIISIVNGNPFSCNFASPVPNKDTDAYDGLSFTYPIAECNLAQFHRLYTISHNTFMKLIYQIALALEYMHSKKTIHRDIKTENILVFKDDDNNYHFKLGDLGFTKLYLRYDTHSPEISNKDCIAPECAMMRTDYTYSSDIWSFGCTLYEVYMNKSVLNDYILVNNRDTLIGLVNTLPYKIDSFDNIVQKKINSREKFFRDPVVNSSSKRRTVENLLLDMLQFEPNSRISIKKILSSYLFNSYICDIEETRKEYIPEYQDEDDIYELNIVDERKWIYKYAANLYHNRNKYPWYKHRILFQSLDNYDRFLVDVKKKLKSKSYRSIDKLERKKKVMLHFICTLYIVTKASISARATEYSILEFLPEEYQTEECVDYISSIEHSYIEDVLNYRIFTMTLYNYILDNYGIPTNDETESLLKYISDGKHNGYTNKKAYKIWKKQV